LGFEVRLACGERGGTVGVVLVAFVVGLVLAKERREHLAIGGDVGV